MRKSNSRIRCDINRVHSDQFTEFCRNGKQNVFVRKRKMPLDDLTFSMINRKGLTLKLELRGYMNKHFSPWNPDIQAWVFKTAYEAKPGGVC